MPEYRTIKELVIDAYVSNGSMPDFEPLTQKVLLNFPSSAWQRSHYSWYKSQFNTGRIELPDINITEENESSIIDVEVESSINTRLSLEKDLHKYLAENISVIEEGLSIEPNGIEYVIEAGRVDILAKDINDNLVVIELKAGTAGDSALGQLLGYMGCISSENSCSTSLRGILVASDFEQRLIFASKGLTNIKLCKYSISFICQNVT